MNFTWFDMNWSWIGLGISALLLILLFATNIFRSKLDISRWRDPVWLAWLAPAAYMVHQFEEYGIDMFGKAFAFPDVLCAANGLPAYPECSVPEATFAAINVPGIWIAGLVCALLSRKHTLIGLSLYAIFSTNAIAHIGVAIATSTYNPGVLTSFLIQLPLSVWVFYAMSGNKAVRKSGLVTLFFAGVLLSAVLLGSVKSFARGMISGEILIAIQILNPALVLFVVWLKEKWDSSTGHPTIGIEAGSNI